MQLELSLEVSIIPAWSRHLVACKASLGHVPAFANLSLVNWDACFQEPARSFLTALATVKLSSAQKRRAADLIDSAMSVMSNFPVPSFWKISQGNHRTAGQPGCQSFAV